jgi:hypothetical protein
MFAQLMSAKQASVGSPRRPVKDRDSAGHPIIIYAAGAPAPIRAGLEPCKDADEVT